MTFDWRWLFLVVPLCFLVLFYFYPLTRILTLSFMPEGGLEADQLQKLFTSPVFGRVIWFTIWQAGVSTVLTIVAALPCAYVFAHYAFPGKKLFSALLTVPFVLPTVVVAAAFRALLGQNGLANLWLMKNFGLSSPPIVLDQTVTFFLIAHVFYNYSLIVRIVGGYWAGLDRNLTEAARMLGASGLQIFMRITLPLLLPAIGSAALLIFIFCFTSFGVVLILGGPGYSTIEVEIYRQAIHLFNLPMAAMLSLIQIGINFMLMFVYARLDRTTKTGFYSGTSTTDAKRPVGPGENLLVALNLLVLSILLFTPLAALVLRSITDTSGGFTLAYYSALFSSQNTSLFAVTPLAAVQNSVGFAAAAMFMAVLLGVLASLYIAREGERNRSLWDAIIMLPLATSAVTLGFGYIISLNRPPLNLRDSLALVPIAHTLVAFPFVIRCVVPSLRQIPAAIREAAAMLGASPWQVWKRVELPLVAPAILVGAVFAFSISMGEFGASAFVTRPHTPTMPVAIFRFLAQPGAMNYGQAMAMSTILMLVTCSGFWLIARFEGNGRKEKRG